MRNCFNRINSWLTHYPLTVAVILVAFIVFTISIVQLAHDHRLDVQAQRLNKVENQQCLDAAYKQAQFEYIDALTRKDVAAIGPAEVRFGDRTRDLALGATGRDVVCNIDLSKLPGG